MRGWGNGASELVRRCPAELLPYRPAVPLPHSCHIVPYHGVMKHLVALLAVAALVHPAEARQRAPRGPAAEAPAQQQPAVPVPEPRPDAGEAAPPTPPPAAEPAKEPEPEKPPAAEAPERPAPEKTDTRLYQTACPAILSGAVEAKLLPPIEEGVCGTHSPYAVSAVMAGGARIAVAGDAVMNCAMATALSRWADAIAPSAAVILKSPVREIRIGTSYQCRRRYAAADGPMSEHAFADAVDMTGFHLEDGTDVSVESGWSGGDAKARFLRLAHDAACGTFTTVLGPEANAAHANHFHLDLSCHGKTCSYRICE